MFRSAFCLSRPSNCIVSSISIHSAPRHHHFPSSPPPLSILPLPPAPLFKSHFPQCRPRLIACAATNGDGDDNIDQVRENTRKPSSDDGKNKKSKSNGGGGRGGRGDDLGEEGGNRRPPLLSNINWVSLLLDPDPNNVIAVGLTGLLTWASVSVLWQLFTISLAILVAALKYSFIAALLIFILITLL